MFEITGIIGDIFDAQTFGKGFTKQEFVLDVINGEATYKIKLECHRDDIKLLNDVTVGDFVEVDFYITGREWQGKYFNNLVCFGIKEKGQPAPVLTEEEQDQVDEEVPF